MSRAYRLQVVTDAFFETVFVRAVALETNELLMSKEVRYVPVEAVMLFIDAHMEARDYFLTYIDRNLTTDGVVGWEMPPSIMKFDGEAI